MKNWMLLVVLGLFAGCGDAEVSQMSGQGGSAKVQSKYLVDSEPDGALPVGDARQTVKDEQAVTLVGTIGGSAEPFVEGMAAFTIVDIKVPYCADEEGCPTPWDYCCTQDQVKENIATVKIVDDAGKPVAKDAKELLGVKELSTVVVSGMAKRDDAGNLTVAANKVFIRSSE